MMVSIHMRGLPCCLFHLLYAVGSLKTQDEVGSSGELRQAMSRQSSKGIERLPSQVEELKTRLAKNGNPHFRLLMFVPFLPWGKWRAQSKLVPQVFPTRLRSDDKRSRHKQCF